MSNIEFWPLVSVVIPVYNVEKYLSDSIESVISQTYPNLEIILVDDGSPDNCPEICDNYARNYENIQVIHKLNGGLSEARNYGIDRAKGEFVLFLDSDDKLAENSIIGLVKKAISTGADVIVPDRYIQVNEDTKKSTICYHFNNQSCLDNPIDFALNIIIGQGRAWRATAVLYRLSVLKKEKITFPVGYIAEDIVFNLQVLSSIKKIAFHKDITLINLKRSGSITTTFQENLGDVFLFIDEKVKEFLINTGNANEFGFSKRNELLSRNSIVFISSIFSDECDWSDIEKIEKANEFLKSERVREAFWTKSINPYFQNRMKILYFKSIFFLIKKNCYNVSYILIKLINKLVNKKK